MGMRKHLCHDDCVLPQHKIISEEISAEELRLQAFRALTELERLNRLSSQQDRVKIAEEFQFRRQVFGLLAPQKWMNFYTKVLSKFATGKGLKLTVKVQASQEAGVTKQKIEEAKTAMRELGLDEHNIQ